MFNIIELVPEKSITLPASLKVDSGSEDDDFGDLIGGVVKNGELGWVANGAHLNIYLMKNKQRISSYTFELASNLQPSLISSVTELFIPDINSPILAVCVQFAESGGMICIFSVQGSRVLRSLEFPEKISICCFIPSPPLKYSGIKNFDGCLAVGTDMGKVFLIDLSMKRFNEVLHDKMAFRNDIELVPVFNVLVDEGFDSIKLAVKKSRKENCHLSVQLQVLQDSGTVLSMLLLPQQMTLAIGLYDGRMILYDLNNLQAFHLAYPPEMDCPLMKLSFIEPLDDPRACVYIWALHYNSKTSIAVMHSIMFEHKQFDPDGFVYFENFQACSPRLTIPLFDEPNNRPINCQSIRNRATYEEEEETSCITVISWESFDRNRINFFVFDLNQWYKDQMPEVLSANRLPNYLALFAVSGGKFGLDLFIYPKSIIPFNSVQRLEEHFYPNSLTFHCIVLSEKQCDHFHWTGVQNRAINYLNALGSKAIVDPNMCFEMLTSTAIFPQYWEEIYDSRVELTISIKRTFLLSIALEYNCLQLLKECIKLWGDGSHLGDGSDIGVSLSTITDWISQRFGQITTYCKTLCQSFFNNIEQQIDYRLKKQLSYSTKQLKTLEKLLEMIVTVNRTYIPEEIRNRMGAEKDIIKMWYEYYEIILWLSNTDILPEGANVPYPYDILNDYYKTQRYTFRKLDHSTRNYLFIDVFLDTKCNSKELRKLWKSTDGEYPPISLEEMLNILILPNTSNEIKYILILYFFMDLSVALEEDRFCNVIENLIKFPSVFKLNSSIIKRIQAYWKLDHGQHETALDFLFSPLSGEKSFETWETEFLIETLLLQNLPKLALRVLQLNNPSINSLLEIKTLLANDLISDAFKVQRNKNNISLLNYFYKFLFNNCKWELLLDYALNDNEIKVLSNFLNNINSNQSENFHIIFLLQRAKYIDAIKLLNKIKKLNNNANLNMNNTNLILTAYNMTLTPAIKNITKSYFNFENEFNLHKKNGTIEQPFSKQLIENPVNSSFNLHKIVFNSIKNCRNGGDDRPQSERVPFLENPYVNRSGNSSQLSDETISIIPKIINSGDHGKRRSDPEPQDTIEFAQPKKKIMTEADYKIKTLKDFKQTRKYDFSESYNKLMENKQNKMTFNDYSFLSKLSTVDEPSAVEQDKSETEVLINMEEAYKTTDDEYFSPEKLKITAEEWNSPLDVSTEILTEKIDEPVELKHHVKFKIVDPLIPEEKVTPEMWNQGEKAPDTLELRTTDLPNQRNDVVIEEKLEEGVHTAFVNMAIPEEKITPEMWNEGVDHKKNLERPVSQSERSPETVTLKIYHVEKSKDVSRKPSDRPSKRRALRSMSKTPERSFRRSRTKTPEPLTPSRKSKRLLEKLPAVVSEPVIEEKLEIPSIVIEDFSSLKSTTTVEIHRVTESNIVSAITPKPHRQPVLDDTEKSGFLEPDNNSKPESSDSSDIVVMKRAPVLRDESDISQLTNESEDLEITYDKKTLFTDSFVEEYLPDVEFCEDDEYLSPSPSSDPSYDDEPVEIDDEDEPRFNCEDDIEEVSEEENFPEEDDDPNRYEVINILSSSSEDTINNSVSDEDSIRDDDNDEIVEPIAGHNKTDDEKIIIESQDLPNEHENTESVANIIYENMDIDIGFDENVEGAELAISIQNPEMDTIETVEPSSTNTEEVDLNKAILTDSTIPEISTRIQEIETTEISESNDAAVADSSIITEPDEMEETKTNVSGDKLNDAVIITELETIMEEKTEIEPDKSSIISTEVQDTSHSLLNQAILIDETADLGKSTFVAEPEENAMTGDVTDSKPDESVTGVINESSFANETKDDSNTLNEALIMVDEEAAEILEDKKGKSENDKVATAQAAETDIRASSTLKISATSVDPEIISTTPKRSTRGSSVPKSIILPDSVKSPVLRKRRSISTDSLTPKKSIHITKADMEIIMEGEVLPGVNTPIKAILAEKLRNTPTRRRSITIEQTETPTTPGRVTRRSSISIEAEGTPIKLEQTATPTRGGRKRSHSIDAESISSKVSDAGSSKSTRKTNKITTPESETHESPIDQSESADYTSNRRLTRHQLAVMEKMDEMRNTVATTLPINETEIKTQKKSKRTRSKTKPDDNAVHSDNESIASTGSSVVSRASSLRSKGSRASQSKATAKGKKEKKSSESTPPTDKPLATIDEDSENDDSMTGPRLRGRAVQSKK